MAPGVTVKFGCYGCEATAEGTTRLRREFRSFSGRSDGFGRVVLSNTVEDVAPEGWMPFDPYTFATYCPACWKSIEAPEGLDHGAGN